MNVKWENINSAIIDLKFQIKSLEEQNAIIRSKLDEENKSGYKMTKILRARTPFNRMKSGEIIFPGKKEMALKLDVMTKEILKLRKVLDGFQRERCQISLTREIFKSMSKSSENNGDNEDNVNKQLIEQLNNEYNKLKDEFDKIVLEISKYRVKLDEVKGELCINEKQLEETQTDFNDASARLARMETDTSESNEITIKSEYDEATDRLNSLQSVMEYQLDEINIKNKAHMNAIYEKEYQKVRANNLCKEKARLTAEFELEFNRIKEYFKKRLRHIEHLPNALQALQEQLAVQREIKTSVEKSIEILSRKLKMMNDAHLENSMKNKKHLTKLRTKNNNLKNEQEKMENNLFDIQSRYEETRRNTCQQKSRLHDIQTETTLKINETRNIFKKPTEEYLHTINKLQNKICKIEAYACFEDGKMKLVSSMMQEQIVELTNILKEAKEQIIEIENLQKYLGTTRKELIHCKDNVS